MNDAQNLNLSLLSQNEIDTLVEFLVEKKNSVDSSVLSQESIDKLIELIRYNNNRRKQETFHSLPELDGSLADAVTVRESAEQLCELRCEADETDGFLKILVHNTENGREMVITPAMINEDDGPDWGRCVSPATFCKIARVLDVKYTAKTYDVVCKLFAECVFGDKEHKIPLLDLPIDAMMIQSLI